MTGFEHIIITGPRKTATSGVYATVKRALDEAAAGATTIFEPKHRDVVENFFRLAPGLPLMIKVTLQSLPRVGIDPNAFDRRVMTVRDPRDIVVSALLFRPLFAATVRRVDAAAVEKFADALRGKEADPASVSVRELDELTAQLGIVEQPGPALKGVLGRQQRLLTRGGFHPVRYEQFVAGEVDELGEYLGLPVRGVSLRGSAQLGHIARTQSSGGFRHWFRPDDLDYYNQLLGGYIRALGYPLDVELAQPPVIDPATSSEHVLGQFRRRRRELTRHRPDRARVLERAGNGDPDACLQLARASGSDPDEALGWARAAARLGSIPAMKLTAELLTARGTGEPATVREARGWEAEYRARHDASTRIGELEDSLDGIRASTAYQLGRTLTDAARDPRRNAPRALRDVRGLWREAKGRR